MWKKARIEELKVGRDGAKRTAVIRGADGRILVHPIQLVTPLEVDQGGEDVEVTGTEYISDRKGNLCICEQ